MLPAMAVTAPLPSAGRPHVVGRLRGLSIVLPC
ncbi:MAG: hypothetical protein V7607_6511, partial [Solirubrobacteraceae bacterium]